MQTGHTGDLSYSTAFKIILTMVVLFFLAIVVSFLISVQNREEISVPDLVNLNIEDAILLLQDSGLQNKVYIENSSIVEDGRVIKQQPLAGTAVKQGRAISLFISRSDALTLIPDFNNKSLEMVQNDIAQITNTSEANVFLQKPLVWQKSTLAQGTVLAQNPPANHTTTKRDVPITLVVSTGS